jgi:hypothetical protein
MRTGGGNFKSPFNMILAVHIGKIDITGGRGLLGLLKFGLDLRLPA